MEGVMVKLLLAPEAVVFTIYTLNNTGDYIFPAGISFDDSAAFGRYLIWIPRHRTVWQTLDKTAVSLNSLWLCFIDETRPSYCEAVIVVTTVLN
jgi:hypothetical protein